MTPDPPASQPIPTAGVWQPIEAAPKDGTEVLLLFIWQGRPMLAIGGWDGDKNARRPRPFWHYRTTWMGRSDCRNNPPTLWMPLPPLPEAKHDAD